MTINSSDLPPRGYYYNPLKDDGPFARQGQTIGELVGQLTAQLLTPGHAPAALPFAQMAGKWLGGELGHEAGFYIDNADAILKNFQTLMSHVNDYRIYMDPASSALTD